MTDKSELSLINNSNNQCFTIFPTTSYEIKDIIANLKPKKTTGFDDINQKVVIKSANEISEVLSEIVNVSFKMGLVPDELKIAKVIPIFKTGDKSQITNQYLYYPYFHNYLKRQRSIDS